MEDHLVTFNHAELQKHLRLNLDHGASFFIRGGIGIGKTDGVYAYGETKAKEMGRKLRIWADLDHEERKELAHNDAYLRETYLVSIFNTLNKLPEDTSGIPMPVNGFMDWIPPMLFYILAKKNAAGILFLDELLQAQLAVQKPLSDLFLNKQISDRRLAKHVGVVGASNRQTDKCGTIEMLPHMKNRMGHGILMPPDHREWIAWARSKDETDDRGGLVRSYIDPRVLMFIASCPDQLYQDPSNAKGDAFPTPRSWHILSDLIREIDETKNKEFFLHVVGTRVGSGCAAKMKAVLDHNMAQDGPEILKDPSKYRACEWDRRVAFAMWMSANSSKDTQFMHRACRFLDMLGTDDMLDTLIYMMKSSAGPEFMTAARGGRYPGLMDALKKTHDEMHGEQQ